MTLEYKLTTDPNTKTLYLQLSGVLNEYADLSLDDIDLRGIDKLVVDFEKLKYLNSSGIKIWILLMDKLSQEPNLKLEFIKCPKFIIDQINTIQGFIPDNGKIVSFYVPIFCERCNKSFKSLETEERDANTIINDLKAIDCDIFPKCQAGLEVDIVPQLFYKFLKNKK